MKQLTAVEWFNQQLVDRQNGKGDSRSWNEILEQAKEIEKEQTIAFTNDYITNADWSYQGKTTAQYYNEKYSK
jgi:hypothetical protein